jgi:TPR repeat protein
MDIETTDDIQFINQFDEDYGKRYEDAKNVYQLAPVQTLSELRDITESICNDIVSEYGIELSATSFYEKIRAVSTSRHFSQNMTSNMHIIRESGNRGVHRKESNMSFDDCSALALEMLRLFCDTVEILVATQNGKTQKFIFKDEVKSPVKEWCYKALFENEITAKFDLGMALFDKYSEGIDKAETCKYRDTRLLKRAVDFIEEAAVEHHHEAMSEYSSILLHGICREKDVEKGINFLYNAASYGWTSSQAHFAWLFFENNKPDIQQYLSKEDEESAIAFAKEASEKDNATAQYVLSNLYQSGKYISKNPKKALSLLKASANSGFTEAMFKLACKYLMEKEKEIENERGDELFIKALKLLGKAFENGHQSAGKKIIALLREESHEARDISNFYEKYLTTFPDDTEECLQFALHLFETGSKNLECVEKGLLLLTMIAEQSELPSDTLQKINKLAPKWLDVFYKLIYGNYEQEQERVMNIAVRFNPHGIPHKNPSEIIIKMAENPEDMKKYIYVMKKPERIIHTPSKKYNVNDMCPCGSKIKYKKCCRK